MWGRRNFATNVPLPLRFLSVTSVPADAVPCRSTDHKLHAEAYEWFEIGFDYFGRTTTQKQTE